MAQFQHFVRPTSEKAPSLVSVTIVSALVGLATGAAGFSLIRQWYPVDINNSGSLGIINKIKFDEPLTVVASQLNQYLAGVYLHIDQTGPVYNQLLTDREYLGSGIIVTSDGWIMLPSVTALPTQADVLINKKIYPVQQQVVDQVMGVRFIKIDATNLSPVRFSHDNELSQGSLLAYEQVRIADESFFDRALVRQVNTIDSSSRLAQIHGTSLIDHLDSIESAQLSPSLYFTSSGTVAGLGKNGTLLPAYYLSASVDKFLAKNSFVTLGVSYIDLYRLPGHKEDEGVLVYNATHSPIVFNSPAQKAGIQADDHIISIGGNAIGPNNSLGKLLLGYKSGDSVKVTIIRKSVSQELTVQF